MDKLQVTKINTKKKLHNICIINELHSDPHIQRKESERLTTNCIRNEMDEAVPNKLKNVHIVETKVTTGEKHKYCLII